MKVGIIGAGNMAGALARSGPIKVTKLWFGVEPRKKRRSWRRRWGMAQKAAPLTKLFPMARWSCWRSNESAIDTLNQAKASEGTFNGKVLIDCNNPVDVTDISDIHVKVGFTTSFSEQIARTAKGAKVVKAYNTCQAKVWEMTPPVFDGRPLNVPICGDDLEAKEIVRKLNAEMGCDTTDIGALKKA